MIEKVAKAMFAQDHDEPWEAGEKMTREIYLANARAAIEAMRDGIGQNEIDAAHAAYASGINIRDPEQLYAIEGLALPAIFDAALNPKQ